MAATFIFLLMFSNCTVVRGERSPSAVWESPHLPEWPPALIVDGIIGYSLQGAPRGAAADLIRWANRQRAPVLSLDVPSGVDTSTGSISDPAIRATATMTLALPKEGLRAPGVGEQVGELYLADIGVPPALYARPGLGLKVGPIFGQSEIVRVE